MCMYETNYCLLNVFLTSFLNIKLTEAQSCVNYQLMKKIVTCTSVYNYTSTTVNPKEDNDDSYILGCRIFLC